MGRLTKVKIDQIAKMRQEGYTQQETAEKVGIHLRTVRRYDPLREQKPARVTPERVRQIEKTCCELVDLGLAYERNGAFGITPLGRRVVERFNDSVDRAILGFMAEAGRPVTEAEVQRYLDEICEELFDQALSEAKRRQG